MSKPEAPRAALVSLFTWVAKFLGALLVGAAVTFYLVLSGGPGASENPLSGLLTGALILPFIWIVAALLGFLVVWAFRWRGAATTWSLFLVVSLLGAGLAIDPALDVDRAWVRRELEETWRLSEPFRAAVKSHWEQTGECPTLDQLGVEELPPHTLLGAPPFYPSHKEVRRRPHASCEFGYMWTDGSDTGRFFWRPDEVYPGGRGRRAISRRGNWRYQWE